MSPFSISLFFGIVYNSQNIKHLSYFNMVLKNIGSRILITNLFADFIVSKIPHNEETIIKVVDCKNFFVTSPHLYR